MHKLKASLVVLLVALVAIFAVQNSATVEIQFLLWSFSMPRVFLVIALLGVGFLVGMLVSGVKTIKSRK